MLRHISIVCIALLCCFGVSRLVTGATAQKPDQDKKTVEGELVDMHCYSTGKRRWRQAQRLRLQVRGQWYPGWRAGRRQGIYAAH
jgi:hypothetical protein